MRVTFLIGLFGFAAVVSLAKGAKGHGDEVDESPVPIPAQGGSIPMPSAAPRASNHEKGAKSGGEDVPMGGKKAAKAEVEEIPAPKELVFILFSESNKENGKLVTQSFRNLSGVLAVPVSPLTEQNFRETIVRTRTRFLNHWWPNPGSIGIVPVAPAQEPSDKLTTDERPWPTTMFPLWDAYVKKIFKGWKHEPDWALLFPLAAKVRCRLANTERSGLLGKARLAPMFPLGDVSLVFFPEHLGLDYSRNKKTAVPDPEVPDLYRCRSNDSRELSSDENDSPF